MLGKPSLETFMLVAPPIGTMKIHQLTHHYEGSQQTLLEDLAQQALDNGLSPRAGAKARARDRALEALRGAQRWLTIGQWAALQGLTVQSARLHAQTLLADGQVQARTAFKGELSFSGRPPLVYTWRPPTEVVKP